MADRIRVTELDFDTIKQNLRTFLKQQNELLKENNTMQKEKILRLESELKACQESNRVYSRQ